MSPGPSPSASSLSSSSQPPPPRSTSPYEHLISQQYSSPYHTHHQHTYSQLTNTLYLTHVHEPEILEKDEEEQHQFTNSQLMFAGAMAGLGEHASMYPVDTVKTRVQANTHSTTLFATIRSIGRLRNFYSGLPVVLYGAIPSHAFYFASYEGVKRLLEGGEQKTFVSNIWYIAGLAGIVATATHDLIATPLDVVKQHMQLKGQQSGVTLITTARDVFRRRGMRAFFISYPTTLLMNIPYTAAHFVSYEWMKKQLFLLSHTTEKQETMHHDQLLDHDSYKLYKHIMAGSFAGAAGAILSTPFDVVKTRLQIGYGKNVREVLARLNQETNGGIVFGLFKGVVPRVMYFMPSASICWITYEYSKNFMKFFSFNSSPPSTTSSSSK